MRKTASLVYLSSLLLAWCWALPGAADAAVTAKEMFHHAGQLQADGNLAETYGLYEKLLLAPGTPAPYPGRSLHRAKD